MAPTANETAKSDIGEWLWHAAWVGALAGWLPALGGYGWHLLAFSGACFCGFVWVALRYARREKKRGETRVGRPLRRLAAAEAALARHRAA